MAYNRDPESKRLLSNKKDESGENQAPAAVSYTESKWLKISMLACLNAIPFSHVLLYGHYLLNAAEFYDQTVPYITAIGLFAIGFFALSGVFVNGLLWILTDLANITSKRNLQSSMHVIAVIAILTWVTVCGVLGFNTLDITAFGVLIGVQHAAAGVFFWCTFYNAFGDLEPMPTNTNTDKRVLSIMFAVMPYLAYLAIIPYTQVVITDPATTPVGVTDPNYQYRFTELFRNPMEVSAVLAGIYLVYVIRFLFFEKDTSPTSVRVTSIPIDPTREMACFLVQLVAYAFLSFVYPLLPMFLVPYILGASFGMDVDVQYVLLVVMMCFAGGAVAGLGISAGISEFKKVRIGFGLSNDFAPAYMYNILTSVVGSVSVGMLYWMTLQDENTLAAAGVIGFGLGMAIPVQYWDAYTSARYYNSWTTDRARQLMMSIASIVGPFAYLAPTFIGDYTDSGNTTIDYSYICMFILIFYHVYLGANFIGRVMQEPPKDVWWANKCYGRART